MRREFAVYAVVAIRRGATKYNIYFGKTGDNVEGCNPVIPGLEITSLATKYIPKS